jgi:hypothetical protein
LFKKSYRSEELGQLLSITRKVLYHAIKLGRLQPLNYASLSRISSLLPADEAEVLQYIDSNQSVDSYRCAFPGKATGNLLNPKMSLS